MTPACIYHEHDRFEPAGASVFMRVCPRNAAAVVAGGGCGLPVLVSPRPDWKEMFIAPGYGVRCGVENVDSVEATLRCYLDDPARCPAVCERGRQRVLAEWNDKRQFAPVPRLIVAARDSSPGVLR